MNKIKVIGLKKSGVEYLIELILKNFGSENVFESPHDPFDRHSFPDQSHFMAHGASFDQEIPTKWPGKTILIYKKLPMWIDAIRKSKNDVIDHFPEIFTSNGSLRTKDAERLWMDYHEQWAQVKVKTPHNILMIRYVDLLKSDQFNETMDLIRDFAGFEYSVDGYIDVSGGDDHDQYDRRRKGEYISKSEQHPNQI